MTLSFAQAAFNQDNSGNHFTTFGVTFTTNFQHGQALIGSCELFPALTIGNVVTITDGIKSWTNSQILDFLSDVDGNPGFTFFLPNLTPGQNGVTVQFLSSASADFPAILGHVINNGENAFVAGHAINFSKSLSASPTTTGSVTPSYAGTYFYSSIFAQFNATTASPQAGFTLANTTGGGTADAWEVQTTATSIQGQWSVTAGTNQDYLTTFVAITQALCHDQLPTLGVGCSLGEVELGAALWAAKKLRENAVIPRRSLLLLKERFSR